jgi:hypothetical protein
MDSLTFISNIASATAWPIATIIIVWGFRHYIAKLLPFTKKFKYGELEIEFEQELQLLKQDIEVQKLSHHIDKKKVASEMDDYIKSTFEVSPRAALVDAWVGLELTAISSARMLNLIPKDKTLPFVHVIRALHNAEVIGKQDVEILNRLRVLRNDALHSSSFNISNKEVEEFIELTRDQADLIAGEAFQKHGGCGY